MNLSDIPDLPAVVLIDVQDQSESSFQCIDLSLRNAPDSSQHPLMADGADLKAVRHGPLLEAGGRSGVGGDKERVVVSLGPPLGHRNDNGEPEMPGVARIQDHHRTLLPDLVADGWVQVDPVDVTGPQSRPLGWIRKSPRRAPFRWPPLPRPL